MADADEEDILKPLNDLLDRKVHERFRDQRDEVCRLFINKTLDLNEHRELIGALALFNVNEVDRYWHNQEKIAKQ